MLDDGSEVREPAVVIEAALLPREQAAQGCGSIPLIGRAAGLEVVDADLGGGVHVPTGLREERRHVAARAAGVAVEDGLRSFRGRSVERRGRWFWRRKRELKEVQ